MSLTAQGKKMVSRSRCDSPAPRSAPAAATPATEKQAAAVYNDDQTAALPLLLVGIAATIGYAALHTDSEKLLGDSPTSIALAVFLGLGILMMRLDFIDAVAEEAAEEGLEFTERMSVVPRWCWFILGCGVALFLAFNGSVHYERELAMQQLSMYSTNLKEAMLRDSLMWAALGAFFLFGAAVMHSDFKEAVREESEKQGVPVVEERSANSGSWALFLGSGIALVLAIAVASWQATAQYGCAGPHIVQELQSNAIDFQDAFSLTGALLLLGDTATWTGLTVFLMLGAVVMRFDFVEAMKEEAEKEGWQFVDEFSLTFVAGCWLILGCGVALTLAGAHRWHLSGYLSEEVGIFFVSAVVAIGLASTIATSPKSRLARAFSPPSKSM